MCLQLRRVACKIISPRNVGKKTPESETASELDLHIVPGSCDSNHHEAKVSSASSLSAAETSTGQSISPIERVLISIQDLLEGKLRDEAGRRHQMDRDQQLMQEWLDAALAIDRICFVALAALLIVGSAVFFVLFLLPK